MDDTREAVLAHIDQLTEPDADDACHALLKLGPSAIPVLAEALRVATNANARKRLAEVIAHNRAAEALPYLLTLLDNSEPEIWKTAIDGLVMLGTDKPAARDDILNCLRAAAQRASSARHDWIREAIEQIELIDGPG